MIIIEDCVHIGKGVWKNVVQHPHHPERIIKTFHPERIDSDGENSDANRIKRLRWFGLYRQFRREIDQYIQLCKASHSDRRFTFPVETPYGLAPTSQGLGLVAEKITAPGGHGLTLERIARDTGLADHHHVALARFFDECEALHIVFGEVNSAGIMYTESRRGRPEFVLVDGIGEKLFIPVRAMSRRINARNIRKVQKKMMEQIEEYAPSVAS